MEERLQKIIARAGVASRRHAEEMIASGLVTVNGTTVTELGTKADESRDHIKVAGKLLRPSQKRVYLVIHKPVEVVATMSDPEGRRCLNDLLYGIPERVFPVGRLEYHAAGLVFLTNDGDLANLLLRSHRVRQTYHLKLKTLLTFAEIETLGRTTGAHIERLRGKESPWYVVTLSEARSDALRDKLFQTGHPVEKIRRVRIANLELGGLESGSHRELSSAEVAAFERAITTGENSAETDSATSRGLAAKYPPRTGSRNSWRAAQHNRRHSSPQPGRNAAHGSANREPGNRAGNKTLSNSRNAAPRGQGNTSRQNRPGPHNDRTAQDKPRNPFFRPGQQGAGRGPSSNMPQTPPRRNGPPNASYITPRIERKNVPGVGRHESHSAPPRTGISDPRYGSHGDRTPNDPRNAAATGQHKRQRSSPRTGQHSSHGDSRRTDAPDERRTPRRNAPRTGQFMPGGRKNKP